MASGLHSRTNTSSTLGLDISNRDTKSSIFSYQPDNESSNTRDAQQKLALSHRKLVFCDPVAFRYLEEDESTIVLDRRRRVQGYELYIVEQWVCSRVHPTFVVCTYTGDQAHSILVNVLAIPTDETTWSRRLKVYFQAVSQFHAREQETPLGTLMVTNLSGFPSALTVILVPNGDIRKHREDFIVNENLKRMGCAGRAAMNLQTPPQSTIVKFQHLYQVSESVPFKDAVMELVRLCQTALVLYGKLNDIYADGLLCDITEKAINDWWNDIGTDFHNIEPSDGILGPTTVTALLGLMIGAYNRLKAAGFAVGKDVLDILSMKRAISSFQRSHKMEKTRRLDRATLDRLHRTTAKMASGDGWTVPKAVKSTVAELSGKGGEMVMGIVGGREKAGISEIETLDIDRFAQLVPGAKMRWLWQGKPMKSSGEVFGLQDDELHGRVFGTDDQGNFIWTSRAQDSKQDLDETSFGNVPGDRRSGLGRLRDAVGKPGRVHSSRLHRHGEEQFEGDDAPPENRMVKTIRESERPVDHVLKGASTVKGKRSFEKKPDKPAFDLALINSSGDLPLHPLTRTNTQLESARGQHEEPKHRREQLRPVPFSVLNSPGRRQMHTDLKRLREELHADVYENFHTEFAEETPVETQLTRSLSARRVRDVDLPVDPAFKVQRHLSFSLVENSVLRYTLNEEEKGSETATDDEDEIPPALQMSAREAEMRHLQELTARIMQLEKNTLPFAESEVAQVEILDAESRDHLSELNNVYYTRLDEYQSLQATSTDLLAREKTSLLEGIRRVEVLNAKLDYELNTLQSRMQEVEDGTADFERSILEIEARVAQLIQERGGDGSDAPDPRNIPWLQKALNFFGSRAR